MNHITNEELEDLPWYVYMPGNDTESLLIRNDLRTGEFQEAYWSWLAATSHNT